MAGILRKWFRVDDPNVVPFKVRMFLGVHWLVGGLGLAVVQPGFLRGLAFIGILSGTFGASVIFWETRLIPEDVIRVTQDIMRAGDQLNLTRRERRSITTMTLTFTIVVVLVCLLIWEIYQQHQNIYKLIFQIELLIGVAYTPILFYYFLIKGTRKWLYHNASLLKSRTQQGQEKLIKRWLQFLAFLCLFAAGICQIPFTLWGH